MRASNYAHKYRDPCLVRVAPATTLTALCQRLNHTRPPSAARAICAAQVYDPKVC